MNSLDRYILRQCITPLTLIIVIGTLVVWLTQTLQRVDIIVEHGQGLGIFTYLSLLLIPSLLGAILPFALFGAAIYTIHRLHTDNEIAVMFAAGVSTKRIAAPLLLITAIGAAMTLYLNIDLMPRSYRILKQSVAEIRADFASVLLRSGEFTKVIDGFTIYVEQTLPEGQFVGLLINDYRDKADRKTYMAERGLLRETEIGPVLYLAHGNLQSISKETGEINFIRFEDTTINISSYNKRTSDFQMELTERYLAELFHPDMNNEWDKRNVGKLIAEGHNRLSSPLYAFAFVLIGLYALIGGAYSRRGYAIRIAIASIFVVSIRVGGFVIQNLAASTGAYWLEYTAPITVILLFAYLLSDSARILTQKKETALSEGGAA